MTGLFIQLPDGIIKYSRKTDPTDIGHQQPGGQFADPGKCEDGQQDKQPHKDNFSKSSSGQLLIKENKGPEEIQN